MKKHIIFATVCLTLLGCSVTALAEEVSMNDRIEEITHDTSITQTTTLLDETSPTGAYVTFRYPVSDSIARVAVGCDEMTFANPDGTDIAPEDWVPGSWVHSNNRTGTARDMELVGDYWCATWPAVNGSVLYYFYVGENGDSYVDAETTKEFCEAAIAADKQHWDPQNEPMIACWETESTFDASQRRSLIYVPRPEGMSEEDMTDMTVQDPEGTTEKGTVTFCKIPGTIDGEDVAINCSVYVPYGFDGNREEKYPLQVLFHGINGDYTQWVAHGAMNHIYDNLIANGTLEPTVVVMPDGMDSNFDIDYILNDILPYMQQNYNAASDPEHMAMSGLSKGGMTTGNVLKEHADVFKYYGGFSCLIFPESDGFVRIDLTDPDLENVKIYASYGDNDYTGSGCQASIDKIMTNEEIDISSEILHGAHQMYYWRKAIEHFATDYLRK